MLKTLRPRHGEGTMPWRRLEQKPRSKVPRERCLNMASRLSASKFCRCVAVQALGTEESCNPIFRPRAETSMKVHGVGSVCVFGGHYPTQIRPKSQKVGKQPQPEASIMSISWVRAGGIFWSPFWDRQKQLPLELMGSHMAQVGPQSSGFRV